MQIVAIKLIVCDARLTIHDAMCLLLSWRFQTFGQLHSSARLPGFEFAAGSSDFLVWSLKDVEYLLVLVERHLVLLLDVLADADHRGLHRPPAQLTSVVSKLCVSELAELFAVVLDVLLVSQSDVFP